MDLTDTHCHIHEAQYDMVDDDQVRAQWLRAGKPDPDVMLKEAAKAAVTRVICVGTTLPDSQLAVKFVKSRSNCWASIGIHPHETKDYVSQQAELQQFRDLVREPKVVAVGECGLDYFYNHSPKADQIKILRMQIELALAHDLPMIFHVREAFDDFWPVFNDYSNIRGVIHSFSATEAELDQIMKRDLYVGLNGIMTFTKDEHQLTLVKALPLQKLLLETDAPYLTPVPFRGTICQPKHVHVTAEFLADLRNESLESLAAATTQNARDLFGI